MPGEVWTCRFLRSRWRIGSAQSQYLEEVSDLRKVLKLRSYNFVIRLVHKSGCMQI